MRESSAVVFVEFGEVGEAFGEAGYRGRTGRRSVSSA